MEKKFLLELEKIKSLMDYDRSNQSKFYDKPIKGINEQTFQEYIQYDSPELTNSGTKSNTGSYFSEKKTFYIGKDTNYPFIFYFGVNQIDKLPVVEGTKVYTIEPGMSSKDFIPDVKIGTIKDDLGVDHPNQEYIEKERTVRENDKNVKKLQKYCLPDKTFWNLPEHIGRVWKFESPASSEGGMFSTIQDFTKTFAMVLQEKEETFYTIDSGGNQVKQTGRNAAMRCRGGDNGWGWAITQPLFFNVESGKSYNPKNPQDLDTRSDWEVFYDHYGFWIETGIAIAATFVGAGAANLIIRLGEAAVAAGRLGGVSLRLWEAVSATYGTTTRLSVFMQMLAEGVMMSPIIKWQISDDRDSDGWLSTIFLFLPLLTELAPVAKLLGGRYTKKDAESLARKIANSGIEAIFVKGIDNASGKEAFSNFIKSLTGTELALWQRGMEIVGKKESLEVLKSSIEELVSSGGKFGKEFAEAEAKGAKETFLGKVGGLIGDEAAVKFGNFSRWMGANINPLTARWVIPHQFIRMGVPITIVAGSFSVAYNALTKEEKLKFEDNFENQLMEDKSYFEALNSIDPYLPNAIANSQIKALTSDEKVLKDFINDPNYFKTEEGKKVKDKATEDILGEWTKNGAPELIKEITPILTRHNLKGSALMAHREFLYKIKFTDLNFPNMDDLNNLLGSVKYDNVEYEINITIENEVASYTIGGKLLTDAEIKEQKWDPNGATPKQQQTSTETTIQNEIFYTKKQFLRNISRY